MITTRKLASSKAKSKDKIQLVKQTNKQSVKNKVENGKKMQHCASKKSIKPKIKQEDFCVPRYQNQNENRINIDHTFSKTKLLQRGKLNSSSNFQMKKSASMGKIKLVRQTSRKSFSPSGQKEQINKTEHQKQSTKPPIKNEKMKKNINLNFGKKHEIQKKAEDINKNTTTRKDSEFLSKYHVERIRTDNSSNLQQSKQNKKKINKIPNKKKGKQKTIGKIKLNNPQKPKQKISKLRQNIKNSIFFSQVIYSSNNSPAYSAIMSKQNFDIKLQSSSNISQNTKLRAIIKIQSHFRGYLTRKYIEQFKNEIFAAIKIQKAWRGYLCRKKLRNIPTKKQLSIQSSLITIKDFNSQPKQQKNKKFFRFQLPQNKKLFEENSNIKNKSQQEQKYIKILQSLLNQQSLQQKIKQKIKFTLGKQKYVETKIISEIISEKSFNSPRQIKTPKSSILLSSPSSWSKNKFPESQYFPSPCKSNQTTNQIQEIVFKRINSPSNKSIHKLNMQQKIEKFSESKQEIRPILTTFEFIQEFEFKIVDYFKDYHNEKQRFCNNCKSSEKFKTFALLFSWNKRKLSKMDTNSQNILSPQYFSTKFRKNILSEPLMKQYLLQSNYYSQLCEIQTQINECFLQCLFDGFSESIYVNYKGMLVTLTSSSVISKQYGDDLFKMILMNALTHMQFCCELNCGAEIPVDKEDPNYQSYSQRNAQRVEEMVRYEVTSSLWNQTQQKVFETCLDLGQIVFQKVIEELCHQFFM